MNSTNKRPSGATGTPQPSKPQPGRAPQHKPVVAQLKNGVPAQSVKRPVAPPVYRPQAKPVSVQAKTAVSSQIKGRPAAPPVYRPQPVPKVLQTKENVTRQAGRRPPEAAQRRNVGIVQRTLAKVTGARKMPGAVVQCAPMVTVNGKKVDAANWSIRQMVDWLHDPQRDTTERQAMLGHLKSKSKAKMETSSNAWAQENPYYKYSTAEQGGAVESFYFESSTNPGKIGRLRSQHAHGPTATDFRYTTQMCGSTEAAAKLQRVYELNKAKGVSLSALVKYGKSLGMEHGIVSSEAQVELFTQNDPGNMKQPVTGVHRSGGLVTFNRFMSNTTEGNQEFVSSWFEINKSYIEKLEQGDVFDNFYNRPK